MSEPFLAEVKIVGFNFAPRGWALCDGQILPINQNQSLYSLLGTIYGGDGRTSFALPDLRGRTPVHPGDGVTLGDRAGQERISLNVQEMPNHRHDARAAANVTATTSSPASALLARTAAGRRALIPYGEADNLTVLSAQSISQAGNSHGHENMQPYLALNFVIALQGLFPSRN